MTKFNFNDPSLSVFKLMYADAKRHGINLAEPGGIHNYMLARRGRKWQGHSSTLTGLVRERREQAQGKNLFNQRG